MSLSWHNITNWHLGHFHMTSWMASSLMWFRLLPKKSSPVFTLRIGPLSIQVPHLYTQATNKFILILQVPMVSNSNILDLFEFLPLPIHFNFTTNIPITPDLGMTNSLTIGYSQSFQTISSSDLQSCLHLWDTFFCNGKKVMETSLKRSHS